MKTMHHGQMSESFLTAVFLSLSGGLQDAYTYLFRGKVFANAQTGNIVLLSAHIMDGQWGMVLHYFIPLCAFAFGVLVAERMRERFRSMQRLHWRQLVVLGEMLLLLIVGFLPESCNLLANAIVSFSCAMQVQAFRKVDGYAFASTMCIGDLRSGVEVHNVEGIERIRLGSLEPRIVTDGFAAAVLLRFIPDIIQGNEHADR